MNRNPYRGPYAPNDRYAHPPQGDPRGDYYDDRRGDDGASTVANIVRVVTGVIASVFVLHILFVVLHANQSNDFVSFVYSTAKVFVLGLGDVFTPHDATAGVVLNYGLAALVYLVIGQLIAKMLRR